MNSSGAHRTFWHVHYALFRISIHVAVHESWLVDLSRDPFAFMHLPQWASLLCRLE